MTLTIRKKGNKNFWHYWKEFEYSASDLVAIFDGDYMKVRSEQGRVVFAQKGFLFSDVIIYDDTVGGGAETYPTVIQLEQRLIDLGYIAFTIDGAVDWGSISGTITNQTDLIDYINAKGINGGTP